MEMKLVSANKRNRTKKKVCENIFFPVFRKKKITFDIKKNVSSLAQTLHGQSSERYFIFNGFELFGFIFAGLVFADSKNGLFDALVRLLWLNYRIHLVFHREIWWCSNETFLILFILFYFLLLLLFMILFECGRAVGGWKTCFLMYLHTRDSIW